MDVNWILILSYIVVIMISTIIPITTISAAIIGMPAALLVRSVMLSQVFGYSMIWLVISLLWRYINGSPLPLAIELIVLTILIFKAKSDPTLDVNGHAMLNAEVYSIIVVSITSAFIMGFSWF